MKRLLFLLLIAVTAFSQNATTISLPEITGDGATHQIATSGTARWVQVIATSGNSAVVRLGDSGTSATEGLPIAAGGGFMYPPLPVDTRQSGQASLYRVSSMYYFAANGDKINVLLGQ